MTVRPNPSPGAVLLTVMVPRGPGRCVDDVLLPGEACAGEATTSRPVVYFVRLELGSTETVTKVVVVR